ncbi:GNAT family N-acetyltransferase [Cryobacterium soli]|uniref:GNAT family N-acetyltransferase n=1 Tax=Cryobacterium soli TaxID=2220095 RepID=UPI000E742021|nr:GNAT family N-acetyltransferase [Cryobacterium soli]
MVGEQNELSIRLADLTGADAGAVSHLVEAYLTHTELEKATYLGGAGARLPERYRAEVDDPARAYENARVYLAHLAGSPVGVVIVQHTPTAYELKRVWVDPAARGHGVGSALIDAALSQQDLPTRLTVWEWRDDAIRLYGRRGFVPVASWEERPRLLCMERAQPLSATGAAR